MSKERELLKRSRYNLDREYCADLIDEIQELLAQPTVGAPHPESLRDHFAGLAMQEFIALNTFKMGLTVTMAYDTADLMLAERGKVHDH